MAVDALEHRIARLEGGVEQIDKRLGSLERTIQDLRAEIHSEIRGLRTELLTRLDRQFFWLLGLLIISILLPVANRLAGR